MSIYIDLQDKTKVCPICESILKVGKCPACQYDVFYDE